MVVCKICGKEANKTLQKHLNSFHKINNKTYLDMFPDAEIYTPEYMEEFSAKIRKFTQTEEFRKKLSDKTKLQWKNNREEMCKALKEAQNTEGARKNHSNGANKYFENRTDEERNIHVESLKKSWAETKEKRVEILKKAHNTKEAIVNHSKATAKFYNDLTDDEKKERNKVLKDTWAIPENREKILELSKIGLKAANSEEGRKSLREANKRPEVKERRSRAGKINMANRPPMRNPLLISSLNIKFNKALDDAGLVHESEYLIKYYQVDFCFPDKKLVVEVDGGYWHCDPRIYKEPKNKMQRKAIVKDKREKTYLTNRGWTLLRFWEKEINSDINKCIEVVKETVNNIKG